MTEETNSAPVSALELSPTPAKRSFLSVARRTVDRIATVVAKNKLVAGALVSLAIVAGTVSAEDAGTWTNIATAVATIISSVL